MNSFIGLSVDNFLLEEDFSKESHHQCFTLRPSPDRPKKLRLLWITADLAFQTHFFQNYHLAFLYRGSTDIFLLEKDYLFKKLFFQSVSWSILSIFTSRFSKSYFSTTTILNSSIKGSNNTCLLAKDYSIENCWILIFALDFW